MELDTERIKSDIEARQVLLTRLEAESKAVETERDDAAAVNAAHKDKVCWMWCVTIQHTAHVISSSRSV